MGRPRSSDIELFETLAAKRRWSTSDARKALEALERSGRTPAEFAARWDLPLARLQRWLRSDLRKAKAAPPIQFAEVALVRRDASEAVPIRVELEHFGVRVMVMAPERCPPSWVAELAAHLETARR